MRKAAVHRTTNETSIKLKLNLDGRGSAHIDTGIRFFDHVLEQIARHGALDLDLIARGDLDVDQHHTVEDVGIALGEAVKQALGSKRGILRAGYFLMPMDESLAACALDFSGRAHFVCKWRPIARRVGDFHTELLEDFFKPSRKQQPPTCICATCTAVRRIIRLKSCSKPSRALCVSR